MRAWLAHDIIAVTAIIAVMLGVACAVSFSRLPKTLKLLVYAALALRIVGSWLRYTVLYEFYGNIGDAGGYYRRGLEYAALLWQLDFSSFFDPSLWVRGKWWGTQFVSIPSGVVLAVTGPSVRAEFLVFSLLGLLGLVGFAVAFRRSYPQVPLARFARWLWLFPSLWYWPSTVGKEPLIIMGLGLAVAGFIGRRDRTNWPLLFVGMFFVFAVRPQVAAVVLLSFLMAQWLSSPRRRAPAPAAQGLLILLVGLGGIWISLKIIGVDGFDIEGVQDYLGRVTARTDGGSTVGVVGVSWTGIPMAMINILFRPFIWEATNMAMTMAALETVLLVGIVWFRRRNLVHVLRNWRADRFLCTAILFTLLYASLLGMITVNLGIIARQRIFLYPFLFLLLEAAPLVRRPQRSRQSPVLARMRQPA